MKKFLVLLMLAGVLLTVASTGYGEEGGKKEQVYAIQNRIYHRYHELDLTAGYMADEDFYYPFPVGIGYTYHFNDHFGWEVARAQWILTQEKDLKKELEDQFGLTPSEVGEPQYMIHSHLLLKPFYGKEAVWNRGIINNETYFLIGGGVIHYEKKFTDRGTETEDAPSFSAGVGTKFFLNQNFCINIELRDLVNFRENNTENRIYLGVGLGFRFNLAPRKSEQGDDVEKLNRYLGK
jgi:outer membrane beta-barrel protein